MMLPRRSASEITCISVTQLGDDPCMHGHVLRRRCCSLEQECGIKLTTTAALAPATVNECSYLLRESERHVVRPLQGFALVRFSPLQPQVFLLQHMSSLLCLDRISFFFKKKTQKKSTYVPLAAAEPVGTR
jgi:hypothetical protein